MLYNLKIFIFKNFREDLWAAVQILHDRLLRIDHAKVIACDMVTKITNHFEKVRISTLLV